MTPKILQRVAYMTLMNDRYDTNPNPHISYPTINPTFQYMLNHENESNPHSRRSNNFIGTPMPTKSPNLLRIYFQNINGIDLDSQGGDFHTICHGIHRTQTDILLLAESRICHNHKWVRDALYSTAKTTDLQNPLVLLSSSKLKYKTYKKPGGTLSIIHGKTRGCVKTSGTDKYGRWSWLTLEGRIQKLVIVNLYQVGNQQD